MAPSIRAHIDIYIFSVKKHKAKSHYNALCTFHEGCMIFTPSLSKNWVKKDCELHQMQVIWVDAKKVENFCWDACRELARASWKISQQMLICVCSSVKIVGFVAKNSICSSFFRSSCQHCWAAATLSVTFRSRQTKDTRYTWQVIAQSFDGRRKQGNISSKYCMVTCC